MFNNFSFITLLFLLFSLYFIYYFYYIKIKKEDIFSWNFNYRFNIKLKCFLLSISLFFLIFSLLEPRFSLIKTDKNSFNEVLFILDVSESMNQKYYTKEGPEAISKLDYSKEIIKDFVLNNPWNFYSLTIFWAETKNILPSISYNEAFISILSWIQTDNITPKKMYTDKSFDNFFSNFWVLNNKKIIVVSDGFFSVSSKKHLNIPQNILFLWVWKENINSWNILKLVNIFWWEYKNFDKKHYYVESISDFIEKNHTNSFNKEENNPYFYIIISFLFFVWAVFFLIFEKHRK